MNKRLHRAPKRASCGQLVGERQRPNIWPNADAFEPQRFLIEGNDPIDFRGKDFELIPFSAGRRICPGLPLAHRMVHLILAKLIGNFEWKVEGMIEPEEINMDEMFGGVTVGRAILYPLGLFPQSCK